jgi:glycosyltransferase involved in cell wall biosynthesis
MDLSVILPTHNPHLGRLQATLAGLRAQTLASDRWETVMVDNASRDFPSAETLAPCSPGNARIVSEPNLGLSFARRAGFQAARGRIAVLVDDDNVLAPNYLADVLEIFAAHPRVGVAGGKSHPSFEAEPLAWTREFFPLLALRDLGEAKQISAGLRPDGVAKNCYPEFAPIGAGMALRREAWQAWLQLRPAGNGPVDRKGGDLTSGGDNDIVLAAMQAGWEVGYFPQLALTHLIPGSRLEPDYLARLNRGIQRSWMQVLSLHDANPWPPTSAFGASLRQAKAWWTYRAWSSPAARIRWQGACGHFEGRVPRA